jgi:MFS family permease
MPAREPLLTPKFLALWVYAFVTFFSAFQLLPAIPFRILELHGSTAEAGWFLSVYTFASAFAAPVMGTIADAIGRRRLLIISSTAFIVFSFSYGVITNLPLLLAVGAIHGALWSGLISAASAIMADYIPESRRMQGLSYWGLASTLAVTIAPAVGLWVVLHRGWTTLCNELVALSILMTIGALLLRYTPAATHGSRVAMHEAWDWNVIRVTLSLTAVTFGYGGITSYSAIVAMQRHIEPKAIYLTVFAMSIALLRLFFSHLFDRFDTRRVLYPSLMLIPIAFALLAIASTRMQMIVSATIFGIGFGAAYPAFASFVLNNTDAARRARTFGSIIWAFDTGICLGSLTIGALGEHVSLRAGFLFAAALSCLAVPIFALTSRVLRSTA